MPVKSKGQRHILSNGTFLSVTFPYGDFCRPRHHTRKQWLFARDCMSREKVRQPCGRTLCLLGYTRGIFEGTGLKEKGLRFASHSSFTYQERTQTFCFTFKEKILLREELWLWKLRLDVLRYPYIYIVYSTFLRLMQKYYSFQISQREVVFHYKHLHYNFKRVCFLNYSRSTVSTLHIPFHRGSYVVSFFFFSFIECSNVLIN